MYLHNHPEALKAYLQSLKIAQEIGNQKGTGNDYSNIGNIYYVQGNYNDALKYQLQALKTYKQIGYKHGLCDVYQSIGLINYSEGNSFSILPSYTNPSNIQDITNGNS